MDATALRAETAARVSAQIATARRRHAAQRATYATKRRRRDAGLAARHSRKLARLETS